jgi:hypothetical protein
MQTQLSTQTKQGVIIFKDKSREFITKQELDVIQSLKGDVIKWKNNHYFRTEIKVYSLDKFYDLYPNERPPQNSFFDMQEEKDNKYNSEEYYRKLISNLTDNIEMRKTQGLSYGNIEKLLEGAKIKLKEILDKKK